MRAIKVFHYFPVDILDASTGATVKGFKFPANGKAFDPSNNADVQNLHKFKLYFGIHHILTRHHQKWN